MVKAIKEYRSPAHKIIAMLKKGRDDLRLKYRNLMEQRRKAENQVRAVEAIGAVWRKRAEAAEAELRELKKAYKTEYQNDPTADDTDKDNALTAAMPIQPFVRVFPATIHATKHSARAHRQ